VGKVARTPASGVSGPRRTRRRGYRDGARPCRTHSAVPGVQGAVSHNGRPGSTLERRGFKIPARAVRGAARGRIR